ncbi:unnamed protein product [Meloidogyne enterolobii]|uniref:Uncharacterized protein n=1 Tax=Meloidogyne enterolobii TaxID=390850 RepID=A0ACB1ANQ9_MELEN
MPGTLKISNSNKNTYKEFSFNFSLENLKEPPSQCPPFEKRQNCINCFSIALASKRSKLAAISFEGIQIILRDNADFGSEDHTPEGQSRAEQLISLLFDIPQWHESPSNQCQALTVLVQLLSSTEISIGLKDVLNGIEICEQVFSVAAAHASSVRPAARAALTQFLNSYVQNRLAVSFEEEEQTEHIGARMDITALISELVARMVGRSTVERALGNNKENDLVQKQQPLLLPLDALISILSALEPSILERHRPLFNSIKGELLPAIICYLHASGRKSSPNPECSDPSTPIPKASLLSRVGRKQLSSDNSNTNSPSSAIISPTAKIAVVEQLLRLFTPLALSSVNSDPNEIFVLTEELWRSALLVPPISRRTEAIRLIKRRCTDQNSFGEFLQLNCASGKDSFWLYLIECLEECCCCSNNDKMAIEVLRTLAALFSAMNQIELVTFPSSFYSLLSQKEENKNENKDEANKKENFEDYKINNNFVTKFAEQFPIWLQCSSSLELDSKLREFAIEINQETISGAEKEEEFENSRRSSPASTPEDSDTEREEREENKDLNITRSEMQEYMFLVAVIYELNLMFEDENWIRTRMNLNQEINSSTKIQYFPILEFVQTNSSINQQLIKQILDKLKLNKNVNENKLEINSILNLFKEDPIKQESKDNEQKINSLLVSRWLRLRLRSCWSSIQRILNQFPIGKSELTGLAIGEDVRIATVEALNSFIPLAIKLGLIPELFWIFEQISERVCVLEDLRELTQKTNSSNKNIIGGQDIKCVRRFVNRPELLAMQGIVENSIQALKIVPNVAKHVVR